MNGYGKGDFNVFRMFVETALQVSRKGGWASQVVPEGLYNGANSMAIRQELFNGFDLKRVLGFENSRGTWFPGIHRSQKFCIYNARKGGRTKSFQVAFNIRSPEQLSQVMAGECLTLPVSLVKEFSPEALAIMELGSQRDIDIAVKMYERWPKFGAPIANAPYRHYSAEIHMGNDRHLFSEDSSGLPLYEGRMVSQFDHRAKGYRSGRGRAAEWIELSHEDKSIQPQWYISEAAIPSKLGDRWKQYRVGHCLISSPTNARSLVGALLPPRCVAGHSVFTVVFEELHEWYYMIWLALANSFCMDFIARKKVSLNMTYSIMDTFPFPRLPLGDPVVDKLMPLSMRLSCVGEEMRDYWIKLSNYGWVVAVPLSESPPSYTDPNDRLDALAQIEAVVAREIFGLSREEIEYVLDTFPIVRESDIETYGDYRTKLLILEHYDATTSAPASPL